MSEENIVKPVKGRLFAMMALEFFIWGATAGMVHMLYQALVETD